jgi:pyridoxal phosphate enzyme (YggS family)
MAEQSDPRLAQLRERLAAVRQRIDGAVAAAGRQDAAPQLIVVTKFHPAEDVRRLASLGITDVGENRDQEAADKAAGLGDLGLRWHFIGQLQSNKAKSVVKYASAVHSVDRPQLAEALAKAVAAEHERTGRGPLDCYIQVSLDDDADGHRGGALPADVPVLAERLAGADGLRLAGVMAVAPLGADPVRAFEKLAGISARLTDVYPDATGISAGMSQDLEAAIRSGATHLRIGSDILGPRPALR